MESHLHRQYRITLWKYRKFRQRLDRRLNNNTLSELSVHHRNRLFRTIERLRRQLATLERLLKYTTAGAFAAATLSLSMPVAAQQPSPLGLEFRVNTYTTSLQSDPSVAMDSDGDFVVTWDSFLQIGQAFEIYAQRYNASGVPQGSEFRVNIYANGYQNRPSVSMDSDGDFVVVWQSQHQDGSGYGIYARRHSALGVPQGSEFRVNTYTTGNQFNPSVALDSNGDFVVTWESQNQDGDGYGIYAQRYDASGVPQGSEFSVSTYTTGNQSNSAIALDSDGDFLVTWTSVGQDGSNEGIYAQRYNASGVAQGSEFLVNTYTTSNQIFPSVAMDSDGDFVVAWDSNGQDGNGDGLYAQRYNASGVAQGSEFRVNTYTFSGQHYSSVDMDSDGDFVVTWTSVGQDGSTDAIYAQRYDASGVKQGDEFRVNTYTYSSQVAPSVAMDSDGDFAVSWTSFGQDGSSNGVYAQRFRIKDPPSLIPTPLGVELPVNTYTTAGQYDPVVATDSDGDFVVTWHSDQDGGNYGIYAQRYNALGVPQGSEFLVNTYTTANQFLPSIAMDSDGDFVITWNSYQDGSSAGVYAQRYNASGVPQGSEFRVNTYTTGNQRSPSVAMDSDGDFVVTWQSAGQDGSAYGVYAQRYNASGVPQGSEFRVNSYTTSYQFDPSVAMDSDGDFVVAWGSVGQDGSHTGIYAQRYNASGVSQGSEFRVNTYTTEYQSNASVAMDSDGDFVVTWDSSDQDGGSYGVYAQRYNASGVPQGSEFLVNTYTTNGQSNPSVAIDSDGDFMVTWNSVGQNGSPDVEAYAQRYNESGVPQGSEFRVNTYTTGYQGNPSVAMDSDGDLVVTWTSFDQDGSGGGIYAQLFYGDSPPVVETNAGLALNEGNVEVITTAMLDTSDAEGAAATDLVYEVTLLPANGVLKKGGVTVILNGTLTQADIDNNVVTYAHNGSEAITDSFKFTVTDGSTVLPEATFAVTVTPVNDSPVIQTNAGLTLDEGATSIVTSALLNSTDVDNTSAQITYQITDLPAKGTLLKNSVVLVFNDTFTQADITNNLVAYQHNGNETTSDTFGFTVTDGTATLPGATFNITVTPVSDAPVIQANAGLTLNEGATSLITSALLNSDDVDNSNTELIYQVTALPANGTLLKSSLALALNDTFTKADITNSLVAYQHNSSETTSDGFNFTLTDGTTTLPAAAFSITVTPVNDALVLQTNLGITVDEGASGAIGSSRLSSTDVDNTNADLVYTLTSVPVNGALSNDGGALPVNGTFTQADINNNLVEFVHDGSETTSDSFGFTVTDGTTTLPAASFAITVTPVNDAPLLQTNAGLTSYEGLSAVIGASLLSFSDADNTNAQIVYSVTFVPVNGSLLKNGVELTVNDTFTQADITNNTVTYKHDGSESTDDVFSFTVTDGTTTLPEAGFNITVTPVSDPPVLQTNAGLTVDEGASGVIASSRLSSTDVDNTNAQLVYTLTLQPAHGTVKKNGTALAVGETFTEAEITINLVAYEHDGSETTSDSFEFAVTDGMTTLPAASFAITVTPLSDAPVLQTNEGLAVNEGASAVIGASALNFTDADNTNAEIQYVVTSAPSSGTLSTNGTSLFLGGTFTQADINSNLVAYLHDGAETTSDAFSFTVSDGNTTTTAESFAITVTPVSDTPVLQTNAGLIVAEGALAVIGTARLSSTDVDNTSAELVYTLTSVPANGSLLKNGTALAMNGTFTQADIGNNLVAYEHDGSETSSDTFSFTVTDGTATLSAASFAITVTPLSDAPILQTNAGLTVDEGASGVIGTSRLSYTDPDNTNGQIVYTLTSIPANGILSKNGTPFAVNGAFTQADIANNLVTYENDGSETTSDAFSFTVTDGTTTLPAASFAITVTPVSDAPVLQTNTGLTVNEGSSGVIGYSQLNFVDADNTNAQITYAVTAVPSSGTLSKNGIELTVNGTFTQADIAGAMVAYEHDGSETTSDAFSFTVTDGTSTLPAASFALTVTPANDVPILQTNSGLTLNEGASGVIGASRLNFTDADNPNGQITYLVTAVPLNGTLSRNGVELAVNGTFTQSDVDGNLVVYEHDDSQTTSDAFSFILTDGTASLPTASFDITVTPLNDAPVLQANAGLTLNEGSSGVIGASRLSFMDADNTGAQIIYSVMSVPSNGTLSKNGIALSLSEQFTQADINDNLVGYQHNGSKTTSDAFNFTVTDGTVTLPVASFAIAITPVNEAPVLQTNTGLTVDEGALAVIGTSRLSTTDVDNTSAQITYSVTSAPSNGTLSRNGIELTVNGTFTQVDIDANLLEYQHDGSETTSDAFSFTVTDGTATLSAASFAIAVTPLNDEPQLLINTTLVVDHGAVGTILSDHLSAEDVEQTASAITFSLVTPPAHGQIQVNGTAIGSNGTFTQADINDELVSYQHDDSETTSDSFTFTVTDGIATLAVATYSITINPGDEVELLDQEITFNAIADKTQGDAPFTLTATSDSGLPVEYTVVSGPATITGSTVTLTGAGTITIRATQAGSAEYNPAESKDVTFCSNPPKPTISVKGANTGSPTLTSSADNGNQWYFDANVIAGATGKSLSATQSGIYKVEVTIGGCTSAPSTDFVLVITGLPPAEIVLHSNPAVHVVRVQGLTGKTMALHILDGSGRSEEVSFTPEVGGLSVDVEHLASGAYMLNIVQEDKSHRVRFIKQ